MNEAEEFPWATALIVLITVVMIVGGGLTVLIGDTTLTARGYFRDLALLAIGIGLLGIGRGVRSGLIRVARRQ